MFCRGRAGLRHIWSRQAEALHGIFYTQGNYWQKWFCLITESQNGRGWKGPLWVIQSNPTAEAGSPTAGCTGPCPGGSWIPPEKETPPPPWAACSSAPSPSEGRSSSSCSDGISCASICARCPLSCHWALLKRAWPHPRVLCFFPQTIILEHSLRVEQR